MKLTVNPKIFTDFSNPRIAVTVVRNVNNKAAVASFIPEFRAILKEVEQQYAGQVVSQIPKISAWREAYRTFGVKAKDYPSSIEALFKRVVRGDDVSGINPLVDIYNYISIKHILPAGGEDIDKMSGDLELTYANDEKPVIVLGKDEAQAPANGEVIYKDELGTICRRWNWREVARTILTKETRNCILVLEALDPVTNKELETAQHELGDLIQKYCGGQVEHRILDASNLSVEIGKA